VLAIDVTAGRHTDGPAPPLPQFRRQQITPFPEVSRFLRASESGAQLARVTGEDSLTMKTMLAVALGVQTLSLPARKPEKRDRNIKLRVGRVTR
jgi:hypothetical protein